MYYKCIRLLIITFNKISIGIKVCKLSSVWFGLVSDLVGCLVIVYTNIGKLIIKSNYTNIYNKFTH